MSFDKAIGFGIDPNKPRAAPRVTDFKELECFSKLGVAPFFIDPKARIGSNREPEQKILLPDADAFNQIRTLINDAQNAYLIPGQAFQDKDPLTSLLLDTLNAWLDENHHSLRYRFEVNPITGLVTQGDFNEKSSMASAKIIGGCMDRYEREREQRPNETAEQAYTGFQRKYRQEGDPVFCDQVRYSDIYVGAGYQCARNEVGIAFKHPKDNVMFVFEACEDFWHVNSPCMTKKTGTKYEFEFEPKQMWGTLPAYVNNSPEVFKMYLYEAMTMFKNHILQNIRYSTENLFSKAEIAKQELRALAGLDYGSIGLNGIQNIFAQAINHSGKRRLTEVLEQSHGDLVEMALLLHREKMAMNNGLVLPSPDDVGKGKHWIAANDDYKPQPIAAIA